MNNKEIVDKWFSEIFDSNGILINTWSESKKKLVDMLSTLTPEPDKGLVEALKDAREVLDLGGARHVIGVDRAMKLIKKIDYALASHFAPRDGWVRVEERLPEIEEGHVSRNVLCAILYRPSGSEPIHHVAVGTVFHANEKNDGVRFEFFGFSIGEYGEVTHWQPLPPPPEVK